MTGTEIYKRTPTYEAELRSIRIHAPQWKLLLAYDGQRTLAEVALAGEMPYAEAVPLTQKFLDSRWIAEEPITIDQYMKRIGAKDISTTGAVVPPAVVLHEPELEKPKQAAPPVPLPVTPPPVAAAPNPPAAVPAPVPSPTPTPPPKLTTSVPAMPPPLPLTSATTPIPVSALPTPDKPVLKRAMKLSAVVDFVTSLVGNVSLGQILVYRVFLRVPPELLLAEDIASVHLIGDTSLINSEKLQKAIADAVSAVAKKALPDSVYA
jgi:hypothetical protein